MTKGDVKFADVVEFGDVMEMEITAEQYESIERVRGMRANVRPPGTASDAVSAKHVSLEEGYGKKDAGLQPEDMFDPAASHIRPLTPISHLMNSKSI